MKGDQQKIWFLYQKNAGRITAKPANKRGWLALSVALIANLIFVLLVWAASAATVHPIAGPISMFVSLPLSLYLTFKMVVAKGQRVA